MGDLLIDSELQYFPCSDPALAMRNIVLYREFYQFPSLSFAPSISRLPQFISAAPPPPPPSQPSQRPQRRQIRPFLLPLRQDLRHLLVEPGWAGVSILPTARQHPLLLRCLVESVRQLEDRSAAHQRFFVVIPDVHVHDVHRSIERGAAVVQVVDDRVPAALFAGEDDVDDAAFGAETAFVALFLEGEPRIAGDPVLEALGPPFDVAVAVEHVQDPVLAVEAGILREKVVVHLVIGGCVEVVDLGLGD